MNNSNCSMTKKNKHDPTYMYMYLSDMLYMYMYLSDILYMYMHLLDILHMTYNAMYTYLQFAKKTVQLLLLYMYMYIHVLQVFVCVLP